MQDVSLPQFILEAMLKHAQDKEAFVCGHSGRSVTYGALREQVFKIAAALTAKGLGKGDVVACLLPNLPEYPAVFLGTTLAGGVCTTINPVYTAHEVTHQFTDANAKFVVTVPLFLDNAREAQKQCPSLEEIFVFSADAPPEGTSSLLELIASGVAEGFAPPSIDCKNDLAALPYSSGTTGLSKGVMLSHANIVSNLCQCIFNEKIVDCTSDDVILAVLPFFHVSLRGRLRGALPHAVLNTRSLQIYGMVLLMFMPLVKGATVHTMMKMDAPREPAFLRARPCKIDTVCI